MAPQSSLLTLQVTTELALYLPGNWPPARASMSPMLGRLWRGWRLLSIVYTVAVAGSEPLGKIHYPSHSPGHLSLPAVILGQLFPGYFRSIWPPSAAWLSVCGYPLCSQNTHLGKTAVRWLHENEVSWQSIILFLLASDYSRTENTNFLPNTMMWNPMRGTAGKSFSPQEECPPILLAGSWTATLKSWRKKRVSRQRGSTANSWGFHDPAELSGTRNHLLYTSSYMTQINLTSSQRNFMEYKPGSFWSSHQSLSRDFKTDQHGFGFWPTGHVTLHTTYVPSLSLPASPTIMDWHWETLSQNQQFIPSHYYVRQIWSQQHKEITRSEQTWWRCLCGMMVAPIASLSRLANPLTICAEGGGCSDRDLNTMAHFQAQFPTWTEFY